MWIWQLDCQLLRNQLLVRESTILIELLWLVLFPEYLNSESGAENKEYYINEKLLYHPFHTTYIIHAVRRTVTVTDKVHYS